MSQSKQPWQRSDVIAVGGLIVAIIALIPAFVRQDVRCFFFKKSCEVPIIDQDNSKLESDSGTNLESNAGNLDIDYSGRIGIYQGTSFNKTGGSYGIARLDLRQIESPNGKVRAELEWSQGLYGKGSIFGIIDTEGNLSLSGTILSEITGIWDTDLNCSFVNEDRINCLYRLYPKPGNPNGTQDGEFTVSR